MKKVLSIILSLMLIFGTICAVPTFSASAAETAGFDLNGWAVAPGTSGVATPNTTAQSVSFTGMNYRAAYIKISNLEIGTTYDFSFDVSPTAAFQLWVVPGTETISWDQGLPTNSSRKHIKSVTGTTFSAQITPEVTSYWFVFRNQTGTAATTAFTFSNFRFEEASEAVLAGIAIADGTWKATNGTVTNNTIAHTVDAKSLSYHSIYTTITNLTPNTIYQLTFDMSANTGFKQLWMVPGSETLNLNGGTYPVNSSTFTATLSTSGTKFVAQFTANESSYHLVFRDHDATVTDITLSNFKLTAVRTLTEAELAGNAIADGTWKATNGTVTNNTKAHTVTATGLSYHSIYTTISGLTPNTIYQLTFDMSANTGFKQLWMVPGSETLNLGGNTYPQNSSTFRATLSTSGTKFVAEFTASETSYHLVFRDYDATVTNITLSNFKLTLLETFTQEEILGNKIADGEWSATSGTVTQDKIAHTVKADTTYHCAYTTVTGLNPNTRYKFSCNYDLSGLYTVYFVNSSLNSPTFNDSVYSGNCPDVAQEISIANGVVSFSFITEALGDTYTLILKHNELTSGAITYSDFTLEKQDEYNDTVASQEFENGTWQYSAGELTKNEDGSITAQTPWHCVYTKMPMLPQNSLVKIELDFTQTGNNIERIYIVSASEDFTVNGSTGSYSGNQTNLATYSIENGKITAYFKTSTGRSGYYFALKHGTLSTAGVIYSNFNIEVVGSISNVVSAYNGNDIADSDSWAIQYSTNGTISHNKTTHTLTQSGNSYQDISTAITGLAKNTTYIITANYTANDNIGGAYVYPTSAGKWQVGSNIAIKTDDTTNRKITLTFSTDSENTDYYLHFRHGVLENGDITYSNLNITVDKCVLDEEIRGAKIADGSWTAQIPGNVSFAHNYLTHTLTQGTNGHQRIYTTIDFLEPNTEYEFTANYTTGDSIEYVYFIPAEQEIDYDNLSQYSRTFTKTNGVLNFSFMTSATGTAYYLMIKHGELSNNEITYSNFRLRAKQTWSNEEQGALITENAWSTTSSTATVTIDSEAKSVTTNATNSYIYVQLTGLSLNTNYRVTCNYTGLDSDISAVYIGRGDSFPFGNSTLDKYYNKASSSSFKNNYIQTTFKTASSNYNYWLAIKLSSSLSAGSIKFYNFKLSIPGVTTVNDEFSEWSSPSSSASYSIAENSVTASATSGSIYTKISGLNLNTTYKLQFTHNALDGVKQFMVFPASESLARSTYWSNGYYNGKYKNYNYSATANNSGAQTSNIVFTTNNTNADYYFVVELTSGTSVTLSNWELSEFTDLGFVGTAVRREKINVRQALRYKNTISADAFENGCFGLKIKEFGSIAAKTNNLNGMPLVINDSQTVGNASVKRGIAYNATTSKLFEILSDGTVVFTAALTNIVTDNYSADYTVRPYIILTDTKAGTDYTIYGTEQDYSVFTVFDLIEQKGSQEDRLTVYKILDNKSAVNAAFLSFKGLDTSSAINLSVYNDTVVSDNYKGLSGTVYHSSGYITDDKTGRNYTDEQREIELARLAQSGVKYCRTRFSPSTIWSSSNGKFNFSASRMQNFINYCKALESEDISVCLQASWYLELILNNNKDTAADSYLNGNGSDLYAEQASYSSCIATEYKRSGTTEMSTGETLTAYYNRIGVAALRYGIYLANFIKAAKDSGADNIDYLIYFTEPSYATASKPEGEYANEYLFICKTIKNVIEATGYAEGVKHVGPNQGSVTTGLGLLKYVVTREPDLFDVLTAHFYPSSTYISDDVYYEKCCKTFSSYLQVLKDAGVEGKEFWVDEFFAVQANSSREARQSATAALQTIVGAISAQQLGIENIILWQLFDQAWGDSTQTSTEFENGIHMCGTCPSLLISDVPYAAYYPLSLFMRFNSATNGKSYRTSTGLSTTAQGIYVGAMQSEDGNWTITVVNLGSSEKIINLDFANAINKTLYRYNESSANIVPTSAASPTEYGRIFENVEATLTDTIAAYSISIYTTQAK